MSFVVDELPSSHTNSVDPLPPPPPVAVIPSRDAMISLPEEAVPPVTNDERNPSLAITTVETTTENNNNHSPSSNNNNPTPTNKRETTVGQLTVSTVTLPSMGSTTTTAVDMSSLSQGPSMVNHHHGGDGDATTTSVATRDIPLLTDKVLCREEEGKLLFQAYQSIRRQDDDIEENHHHNKDHSSNSNNHSTSTTTPLVMIHGVTGIGKTCLAQSLRDTVTVDGGYFCAGKFEQGPKPHDAVSIAFGSFCTQVLEQSPAIQQHVRDKIWEALGSEAPRLIRRIPELHQLLHGVDANDAPESTDAVPDATATATMENGGSEAINRFKNLLRLFVQAVACPERPLVLFLDDLHWADESSLDLVWSLINDAPLSSSSHGRRRGVLFLCTVRDDADTSLIEKQLSCLGRSVHLLKISLQAFTAQTTNIVLSQLLHTTEQQTQSLTAVVHGQTKGNIFFITELLRLMREEKLLWYDKTKQEWMWDEEEIRIEFDGIRDLVQKRIGSLSSETKNLLKLAACLGTKLHQDSLGYLMESPILKLLVEATDRGIVVFSPSTNSFAFAHDGIKDVVYNLIPIQDRERFHYTVGRRLWKAYPADDLLNNNSIYVIVGQLLLGKSQILSNPRECSAVSKLCLQAGVRAMRQSSFSTAYTYLMQGIELLGGQGWETDYQLCLSLHNFAAEVAYCTANFDSVFQLVETILDKAQNFNDKLSAQATNVYALGSSGKMQEAIDRGLNVLQKLGVEFPAKLTLQDVDRGLAKTTKLLRGKSNESLLRLPVLQEPSTIAAMHMLNLLFVYAFLSKIELAPFIGFKMIEITLAKGVCAVSCVGFGVYAMVLSGIGNDIDEGYRYGKLAITLLEKSAAKAWLCRVSAAFYGCVHGWKRPVLESVEPLRQAYRIGMECGDIEFAMINANLMFWNQLDYTPLNDLDQEISVVADRMKFYGQETSLMMMYPYWQFLNNHMGRGRGNPLKLIGDIFDETSNDMARLPTVYAWSSFHRMNLSFLLGDYQQALMEAKGCDVLLSHPFGASDVAIVIFFRALTHLALAATTKPNRKHIAQAQKDIKRISQWAKHSPLNFLGRKYLLEAELAVVKGDHSSTLEKYTTAVALSREAGMLMQTALANERAGRYFLSVGDKENGTPFMKEAFRWYREWGGVLKLRHLSKEFGQFGERL